MDANTILLYSSESMIILLILYYLKTVFFQETILFYIDTININIMGKLLINNNKYKNIKKSRKFDDKQELIYHIIKLVTEKIEKCSIETPGFIESLDDIADVVQRYPVETLYFYDKKICKIIYN